MTLGWLRNGKWHLTKPPISANAIWTDVKTFRHLGFLSASMLKLLAEIKYVANRELEMVNFASNSRVGQLDGDKTFGQYLNSKGISDFSQASL